MDITKEKSIFSPRMKLFRLEISSYIVIRSHVSNLHLVAALNARLCVWLCCWVGEDGEKKMMMNGRLPDFRLKNLLFCVKSPKKRACCIEFDPSKILHFPSAQVQPMVRQLQRHGAGVWRLGACILTGPAHGRVRKCLGIKGARLRAFMCTVARLVLFTSQHC